LMIGIVIDCLCAPANGSDKKMFFSGFLAEPEHLIL